MISLRLLAMINTIANPVRTSGHRLVGHLSVATMLSMLGLIAA